MELDPNHADVAYRCGGLFALREKAQTDSAGGDLNSTVKTITSHPQCDARASCFRGSFVSTAIT